VPFLPNVQFVLQSEKQDVQVNEMDNQIVSISADSVIKVWDMRSSRCLQTIVEKSINKPSRCNILYDNKRQVHTQLFVLHLLYAFKAFAT
jgi:WD40 repeat protein